jgi:uncharacterized protein YkwD
MVLILGLLLFAASAGAQQPSGIAREFTDAHNAVRKTVGVAPLRWSERLAASAKEWADSLLASGRFTHRPGSQTGENLYELRGASATPTLVVRTWADEGRGYDYSSNQCRAGSCGHYTQIVWRDTHELGCAVARARGREVWVCEYNPAGNWEGQRPY